MDHLVKDENLELAILAKDVIKQRSIKNLGEVYLTLGFAEIKQKGNLDSAEEVDKLLSKMINEKFLVGKIN